MSDEQQKEPEPLCVSGEVIQRQVDEAISQFDGEAKSVTLPPDLYNAFVMNNKFDGFVLDGGLSVWGHAGSEIIIK